MINFLLCLLILYGIVTSVVSLSETERVKEYAARGYSWPPEYQPATKGWKKLMEDRFAQIEFMSRDERYEAYIQTIPSAFYAPNFTEYGFALGRAPEALTTEIREAIWDAVKKGKTYQETHVNVIEGPQAQFVSRQDLVKRVLRDLQPFVEGWSGEKVKPNNAYGFRLYQNQSALHMHTDKVNTHVLSAIYHIDSSDDAEPWPIFIEDLHGRTYEVVLTPGDILFYESTKCFHGRPRKFNGSWYTSVFVHYYPTNWQNVDHYLETHYAVPPRWDRPPPGSHKKKKRKLEMVGTGMKEPQCPDSWCRTRGAIQWSGPGEDGVWIAPSLEKYPLQIPATEEEL